MARRPPRSSRPPRHGHDHRAERGERRDGRPSPRRARVPAQRDDTVRVTGVHATEALLSHRPDDVHRLFVTEAHLERFKPAFRTLADARKPYRIVTQDELDRVAAGTHHEGVCAVAEPKRMWSMADWSAHKRATGAAILLENVGNPHNLGAILRVAAHFGVQTVFLLGDAPTLSGAVHRTSEGGAEVVDIVRLAHPDELDAVSAAGFALVATSSHVEHSVLDVPCSRPVCYLFGNEGRGLTRDALDAADMRAFIPGAGRMESLNVACATSVVLGYDHVRRTGLLADAAGAPAQTAHRAPDARESRPRGQSGPRGKDSGPRGNRGNAADQRGRTARDPKGRGPKANKKTGRRTR